MTQPAAQRQRMLRQAPAPARLPEGLDVTDARIINHLQDGLPLTLTPFADAARALGLTEDELLSRLRRLLEAGFITRLGPLINADAAGGAYMLAALAVPPERFEEVAAQVNAHDEVAHNYARDHHWNMWFVLAAPSMARVRAVADEIERETGLPVLRLPKLAEYFVHFRLRLPLPDQEQPRMDDASPALAPPPRQHGDSPLEAADRRLLGVIESGLPLRADVWAEVGRRAGLPAPRVPARLRRLQAAGVIRRVALVPHHFRLGWRANGMTVWDVDDARIDELGRRVGALPFVSHCYRRPRQKGWRYNLFAMVHGQTRAQMLEQVAQVARVLGGAARAHEVLRSTRILKKSGVRLFSLPENATPAHTTPDDATSSNVTAGK